MQAQLGTGDATSHAELCVFYGLGEIIIVILLIMKGLQ